MRDSYKETDDLVIVKINEAFVKVIGERSLLLELSEFFTFFTPNYQFSPKYKNKIWDGKIRLFSLKTNYLPYGLLSYLFQFAKERNYSISSKIEPANEYSVYLAEKFIKELVLPFEPFDYQVNGLVHTMRYNRALFISPTGSGKSLSIYLMMTQLRLYKRMRGLIIVHSTTLVEQMYSDFIDYSINNTFDVSKEVHRLYDKQPRYTGQTEVLLSTWQSIKDYSPEFFEQFDFVIADEAHLCKANSIKHILESCVNAEYRVTMTGTLDGAKTHQLVIEGLFGNVEKLANTKDLQNRNILTDLEIKCLILKHDDIECNKTKNVKTVNFGQTSIRKFEYKDEIKLITDNRARNKFIKNLALSMKNNTLVLFQYTDHGKKLYDMIKDSGNIGNRKVFYIDGKITATIRETIRKVMSNEENSILVASYGTLSTGVNIKNLHNLIFASPSKSVIKILQSIGRILRTFEDKDKATLYDVVDDLKIGTRGKDNYAIKHFEARLEMYNRESFPFKIYNIKVNNNKE